MASSVQLCAEVTVSSDYHNEVVSKEDAERALSEHMATRDTLYREDVQSNAKKVLVVSFS